MALLPGGGYAERVAVAEGTVMPIPEHLSWREAAAIPEPMNEPMDLAEVLMTEPLANLAEAPSFDEPTIESANESTIEAAIETPLEAPREAAELELPPPPAIEAAEEPPAYVGPDFSAVAEVCTAFGQVHDAEDLGPLLGEAARVLDAPGVILWIWDPSVDGLRPAYARTPGVAVTEKTTIDTAIASVVALKMRSFSSRPYRSTNVA